MMFCSDIHVALRMNPNDYDDLLTLFSSPTSTSSDVLDVMKFAINIQVPCKII